MVQETPLPIKRWLQVGFAIFIIGLFLVFFFLNLFKLPPKTSFERWYGNWPGVLLATVVFLFFIYFLTRPRRPSEWRNAGLTSAFFVSLFTEMFGIPLTIYLVAPLLGVEPKFFGMHESHLWAYLLSWVGVMSLQHALYMVMVGSAALLVIGFTFLSLGWKEVYRGEGRLVTDGVYERIRHPQYLGLILVIIAFLIQWPTLLTLLLAPLLTARYILLAGEEDRELEKKFGEDFRNYKKSVPGFYPLIFCASPRSEG